MSAGTSVRVAAVQLRGGRDVAANLAVTLDFVNRAADAGASYVQTPEITNIVERDRARMRAEIRTEAQDPTLAALREVARDRAVTLHVGSLALAAGAGEDAGAVNRAIVIGPDGGILARYDKIHMFDVAVSPTDTWRESDLFRPGDRAVVVDVPDFRLGLSICYDLRFPALYAALAEAGARVLSVPACFTQVTGEAHWHALVRARAIENGAFVVAACHGGRHEDGRSTFGHSLVVDPWGAIVAEAGQDPGLVIADIDLSQVDEARGRIPSLANRRPFRVDAPVRTEMKAAS